MKPSCWQLAFGISVVLGAAMACGSNDDNSVFGDGTKDAGHDGSGDDGGVTLGNGEGGVGFGGGTFNPSTFALTPATSTLTLTTGADGGALSALSVFGANVSRVTLSDTSHSSDGTGTWGSDATARGGLMSAKRSRSSMTS